MTKRSKYGWRWLVAAAMIATAAGVSAAPVTFAFAGGVTDDPFGTGLTSFAGSFTFDSAAADAAPAPSTGSYTSLGPAFGIEVSFDAGAATAAVGGTLNVGIANNFAGPVDQYTVTGIDGFTELALFLEDASAGVFASDALPPLPPALAAFSFRQFRWFGTDPNDPREILGTVDTLSCVAGCSRVPLPEPVSGALVSIAIVAMAAATLPRRKRRR